MLNKIAIAAIALTLTASAASADEWRHHDHYQGNGGGGNWVAPLIGGMILGGVIMNMNQPRYQQPIITDEDQYTPVCRDVFVGRDYWGRPVIRRICQ